MLAVPIMPFWISGGWIVVAPPTVTITSGPTASKVSRQSGFNTSSITWRSDQAFAHYQIRVVPATTSPVTVGTQVETDQTPAAGGLANTDYTDTILDTELTAASALEGSNILKIFVQNSGGTWST